MSRISMNIFHARVTGQFIQGITKNAPFYISVNFSTADLLERQAIPQITPVKPITDIKLMIITYNTLHSEKIKDNLFGCSNSTDTTALYGHMKLTFWREKAVSIEFLNEAAKVLATGLTNPQDLHPQWTLHHQTQTTL